MNEAPRVQWDSKLEFLLTCMSTSVGLGNVWRFPMKAYQFGGGAFFLPYLILLLIIGRPLYFLEMVLGQFSSKAALKVWNAVPAFKGVGYAQAITLSFVAIYYNYLMALSLLFAFYSMKSTLPWSCEAVRTTLPVEIGNTTMTCAQEFWEKSVLNQSSGLGVMTSIQWPILASLALAWILVFLSVSKGVKSIGKVSYVTAIFPYIVLVALLVVSALKKGAIEGILYLLTPKWNQLFNLSVWNEALIQSFFSLNVGYGSVITLASYNNFRHNINRDGLIISLMDTITSILAGTVVFSVLGGLANELGIDVSQVARDSGMGLSFIVYPEAMTKIGFLPQLWSIIFFLMLVTLALGSSISMIETILTTVKDLIPSLERCQTSAAAGVCFFFFLCGVPLTTDAGQHIMMLLDEYGVGKSVFLYTILTVISSVWIYGYKKLFMDVLFMMKKPLNIFWKITWVFITPVSLLIIFCYSTYNDFVVNTEVAIPLWGKLIGYVLLVTALSQIPLWYIIQLFQAEKESTFVQKIKKPFKSLPNWGPADSKTFEEWNEFKKHPFFEKQLNNANMVEMEELREVVVAS